MNGLLLALAIAAGGSTAPGIDAVAGDMLEEVWGSEEGHRLIRIRMPAGATLPDHASGPRVIFTLEDLALTRVSDGSEVAVQAPAAFWLTNTLSGAVRNDADRPQSYYALLFPEDGFYEAPAAGDSTLAAESLLDLPWIMITEDHQDAPAQYVLRIGAEGLTGDEGEGAVTVLVR